MSNKKLALVPLVVLLSFFVHFVSDFYFFLNFGLIIKKSLIYFLVIALLYFSLAWLFKNRGRFTFAFSTVLFLFLFYGSISDTAASLQLINASGVIDLQTAAWSCIFFASAFLLCCAARESWLPLLLKFWLFYGLALIVYDLGSLMLRKKREEKYLSNVIPRPLSRDIPKPDVYFLLFDMYPSNPVLSKHLGYNNAALDTRLRQLKFFVTGNSRSLYQETYYSVPSTLAMQPLEYIGDNQVADYKKKLIALKMVNQAMLPRIFSESGYQINNYSLFKIQDQKSPLEFNLNYHLENLLTSSTFFNRWFNSFETDFFKASKGIDLGWIKTAWSTQVKKDLQTLEKTLAITAGQAGKASKPMFNYFHFMMPHPPVLYDSMGKENSVRDMYAYNGFGATNKNFTSYIKFTNKKIAEYIALIMDKTKGRAVIIVQGDHGYREFAGDFPEKVRLGILNAVYLPNQNYRQFQNSMTPIQSFTQVLANQFGYTISPQ